MKEGLVTKIEKNFIVIKTKELEIERIKTRSIVNIGDRIQYEKKDIYRGLNKINYKKLVTSLSMFVAIILVGVYFVGRVNQNRIYGVVSIDVNPSIQIYISKSEKVLKVSPKTDISDVIINEKLTGKSIYEVLTILVEEAYENKILFTNDPIVISYVPIDKKDKLERSIKLESFLNSTSNIYIYIISDEAYLASANHDNKTVGKMYLEYYLEKQNIVIDDDKNFIRNAVEVLEKNYPDLKKYQRMDINTTTNEINIYGNIILEESSSETETSDNSSNTEVEESKPEDSIFEESDHEEVVVEDETEEVIEDGSNDIDADAKREERIRIAKDNMSKSSNFYLALKTEEEKLLETLNATILKLKIEEDKLNILNDKLYRTLQLEKDYKAELIVIEDKLIREMNPLLLEANINRDNKISNTKEDVDYANQLEALGDEIYNAQLLIYNEIATSTIDSINAEIEQIQSEINLLKSSSSTGDTTALIQEYEKIIEELNQQISVILNRSDNLTLTDKNYVSTYNEAYSDLKNSLLQKDSYYDNAKDIKNQVDKVIVAADETYKFEIESVNDAYKEEIDRKIYLTQTIDDIFILKNNITENIGIITPNINSILEEIKEQEILYQEAVNKTKKAYTDYLEAKKIFESF